MYKFISSHVTLISDIFVILFSPFALWKFTYSVFFSDSSPFMRNKVMFLSVSDLFTMLIVSAIVIFVYHIVFYYFFQSTASVVLFFFDKKERE